MNLHFGTHCNISKKRQHRLLKYAKRQTTLIADYNALCEADRQGKFLQGKIYPIQNFLKESAYHCGHLEDKNLPKLKEWQAYIYNSSTDKNGKGDAKKLQSDFESNLQELEHTYNKFKETYEKMCAEAANYTKAELLEKFKAFYDPLVYVEWDGLYDKLSKWRNDHTLAKTLNTNAENFFGKKIKDFEDAVAKEIRTLKATWEIESKYKKIQDWNTELYGYKSRTILECAGCTLSQTTQDTLTWVITLDDQALFKNATAALQEKALFANMEPIWEYKTAYQSEYSPKIEAAIGELEKGQGECSLLWEESYEKTWRKHQDLYKQIETFIKNQGEIDDKNYREPTEVMKQLNQDVTFSPSSLQRASIDLGGKIPTLPAEQFDALQKLEQYQIAIDAETKEITTKRSEATKNGDEVTSKKLENQYLALMAKHLEIGLFLNNAGVMDKVATSFQKGKPQIPIGENTDIATIYGTAYHKINEYNKAWDKDGFDINKLKQLDTQLQTLQNALTKRATLKTILEGEQIEAATTAKQLAEIRQKIATQQQNFDKGRILPEYQPKIDHLPAAKSPQTKIREFVEILNKDITYAGGKLSISKKAQQALQELGKLQDTIKTLDVVVNEGILNPAKNKNVSEDDKDVERAKSMETQIQQFAKFKNASIAKVKINRSNGYTEKISINVGF